MAGAGQRRGGCEHYPYCWTIRTAKPTFYVDRSKVGRAAAPPREGQDSGISSIGWRRQGGEVLLRTMVMEICTTPHKLRNPSRAG